jgi:hypothetical protein
LLAFPSVFAIVLVLGAIALTRSSVSTATAQGNSSEV